MNVLRSVLFAVAFYVGSFAIVTTGVLWSLFDRRAVRSTVSPSGTVDLRRLPLSHAGSHPSGAATPAA